MMVTCPPLSLVFKLEIPVTFGSLASGNDRRGRNSRSEHIYQSLHKKREFEWWISRSMATSTGNTCCTLKSCRPGHEPLNIVLQTECALPSRRSHNLRKPISFLPDNRTRQLKQCMARLIFQYTALVCHVHVLPLSRYVVPTKSRASAYSFNNWKRVNWLTLFSEQFATWSHLPSKKYGCGWSRNIEIVLSFEVNDCCMNSLISYCYQTNILVSYFYWYCIFCCYSSLILWIRCAADFQRKVHGTTPCPSLTSC